MTAVDSVLYIWQDNLVFMNELYVSEGTDIKSYY